MKESNNMFYGLNYYKHTLRKYSATAEDTNMRRWAFLEEIKPRKVLDYGSGVGWFRAWKPVGVQCDSYDICSISPQTGITEWKYDVVCFWDSLEHILDLSDIYWILEQTEYVAISIPIKPESIDITKWHHYRPHEHLHYFTLKSLHAFFAKQGFEIIKANQNECPPRIDIWTILYRKIQ